MQWAKIPNTLSKRQERVTARARAHTVQNESRTERNQRMYVKSQDPKKQAQTNEAVKMFNKGRSDD